MDAVPLWIAGVLFWMDKAGPWPGLVNGTGYPWVFHISDLIELFPRIL